MLPDPSLPSPTSDTGATLNSEEAPAWGQGAPPDPQSPDSRPPYSRRHRGQAWQCQTDGPCRESLAWDEQDAEMALPPQDTGPHGQHRDGSQPRAEAQVQDPRRHPSLGLGPRAAQRPHRGVGAVSSQRCPRPCAPTPAARSHTHFIHRRGPPARTHISRRRGKRSSMAGVRRSYTRVPGECSPGTGQCLPGDRHPIPREGIPTGGPHRAIPWEGGQEKAMH